jgi:hypothetical protein
MIDRVLAPYADRRSDEPQVAIGCSRRKLNGYGKTGRSEAGTCPVPVAQLQREIRKIDASINRSASLDELDRAWATLWRLQEALAVATTI